MIDIVSNSFNKNPKRHIATEPFIFDVVCENQPTTYDISFVVELMNDEGEIKPTRVDYGFVTDKTKIYEEWLSVYPKGREQNWFHREYNFEKSEYDWKTSPSLKGEKESWKKQTRNDQLFLSSAVHLNSEQMKPIYESITGRMPIVRTDRISNKMSKKICKKSKDDKLILLSLLQSAGIEVDDIIFEKPNIDFDNFPIKNIPDEVRKDILEKIEKDIISNLETIFIYKDSLGNHQKINLKDESDGTQKLFEFAGLILAVLNNGDTLIIDELNKSLHPDLVRFLVKLFNSKLNRKNAQLIFTTHETSVLRKDLLRRDQIWFCEKDSNRATNLYPLTDFKPHISREDIEEYYLNGRYGAKPILQDFILPEHFWKE